MVLKLSMMTVGLLWLLPGLAFSQSAPETYAVSAGRAVVVGNDGSIFVAGWMAGELAGTKLERASAFLAKFTVDGALLWLKQFGSEHLNFAYDLALDATGNVVVVGSSGNAPSQDEPGTSQAFVALFDADGELLWLEAFGYGERNEARAVAVDAGGDIFVVGETCHLDANDCPTIAFLAKYTIEGQQLWIKPFNVDGYATATGVAVDSEGNVRVVGSSATEPIQTTFLGAHVYVASFDPAGRRRWLVQFGDAYHVLAYAVQVDGEGNAFVAGDTPIANNLGERDYDIRDTRRSLDAFLAKIDAEGQIVWIKQFGAGKGYMGFDVAVDHLGNAVVVGAGNGNLGGEPQGLSDAFVAKYAPDGTRLWAHQFGTPMFDGAYGVAVDAADQIFITGYLDADWQPPYDRGRHAFLAKYDPHGQQLWLRTFESAVAELEQRR
ncbi:MAG: hypothetical protein KGZ60_12840 [Truepera sp.]|nr:hypothetical protein [Truepera sp.]